MKDQISKLATSVLAGAKAKKPIAKDPLSSSPKSGKAVKQVIQEPKAKFRAIGSKAKHPHPAGGKSPAPGAKSEKEGPAAIDESPDAEYKELMASAASQKKPSLGEYSKKVLKGGY